jgi:CHAD domain-containing protein
LDSNNWKLNLYNLLRGLTVTNFAFGFILMDELIKAYYLEHKGVFDDKFNIVMQSFDMDAIHKMRTSTKRLRALFQLIEYVSSDKFKAKKQLKKVRLLFKHAGKIREIQIEKSVLSRYEESMKLHFPDYMDYLSRCEHREIARFLKSIPRYADREQIIDHDYVLKAITSGKNKKQASRIQKYLKSKVEELHRLNSKPVSNERIHRNRTILKQLYYLYDILELSSEQHSLLNLTSERLREIEQKIGNWHDLINSTHYLNNFHKTKYGSKTPDLKALKQGVIYDRNRQRKEIIRILKKEVVPTLN